MGTTPVEVIQERLREACDIRWMDSLYAQQCYAFGEPWRSGAGSVRDGGTVPWYEPVRMRQKEVGRSMKIISATLITLSKILNAEPEPDFPQIPKHISEVRKQFYLARYKARPFWGHAYAQMFLNSDSFGLGIMEHGFRTNQDTGEQQVTVRCSPTTATLADPYETDPSRWRMIAFLKILDPDVARQRFGKKKVDDHLTTIGDCLYNGRKVLRVIEYYDTGINGGKPTYACIPTDVGNEPFTVSESWAGTSLPFSYAEHVLLPGMDHHVGRVILQMATQEARNNVERAMRNAALDIGYDVVDSEQVNKQELQSAIKDGKRFVFSKTSPSNNRLPVNRMPGREVSNTSYNLVKMYDQELNTEGGTTDAEKGNLSGSNRTLGENQLVDQRSSVQGSWSKKQAVLMFIRGVEKTMEIAAKYDTDRVSIDVFGVNVTLNDPADPRSALSGFLEEPSEVVINAADLEGMDVLNKKQQRLAEVALLQADPLCDPVWAFQQKAKIIGVDPSEAMRQTPVGPPMGQPGTPGQPQPGAPAPVSPPGQ